MRGIGPATGTRGGPTRTCPDASALRDLMGTKGSVSVEWTAGVTRAVTSPSPQGTVIKSANLGSSFWNGADSLTRASFKMPVMDIFTSKGLG